MKAWIAIAFLFLVMGCDKPNQITYQEPSVAPVVVPVPAPAPTREATSIAARLAGAKSLNEAWNICSPGMGDKFSHLSIGGICLATWGQSHLTWNAVHPLKDETSPGLVFKNSSSQLGKRICSTGTVIEISEDDGMSEGELLGFSGTIYHFFTVGSSGSIVQHSTAHLCGIVVGTYSYSNSAGGTAHTVDLVGMWDLNYHPEN